MKRKMEINKENFLKIKNMYEIEGISPKKIHLQLGIPLGSVRRIILENRMVKGAVKKNIRVSKEDLYNIYINKGYSIEKAAQFFNVSKRDISNKCKEFGIKIRKAGYRCKGIKEADLLQLYIVQGLTMADIAKKYGCAIFTIQKYFKKYNIQPRKKGNLILKEELEDLYINQKLKVPEIAKKLKYSEETVLKHMELYGYKTSIRTSKIPYEKIKRLCDNGLSTKEIAKEFNCSPQTIRRFLCVYGLETQKSALQNISYQEFYNLLVTQRKEIKEVASLYNVSQSSIKLKLREYGINLIAERTKYINEKALKELYYEKGMTQQEIASYFNVGRDFILKKCKEYGITKRRKSDCLTEGILRDLYVKQNIPQCDIADKFGLDTHQVLYKIKVYHLEDEKTEEQKSECHAKAYERALNKSRSKGELEIQKLFPTSFTNTHSIIKLELDLWYPEQKVAIEYNGDYWHSIQFPRNSGLHLAKLSMCENKGIRLINIFERDWNNKKIKEKIITLLSRSLNPEKFKNPEGIITETYNYNRKKFERKYNILGESNAEFTVGLLNNKKEFISSLSYAIKKGKCYIERFTTHENYLEDYTTLILYLKNKYNLPITVKCDKRYYKYFPANIEFKSSKEIKPELFLVVGNKAKREHEASEKYKNNPRCFKVYDCGFIEYTFI